MIAEAYAGTTRRASQNIIANQTVDFTGISGITRLVLDDQNSTAAPLMLADLGALGLRKRRKAA